MNCGHSREQLALFIEDDLTALEKQKIRRQVGACAECRLYCEQLQVTQSLIKERLKSPLQAPPDPEVFTAVRARVLSQIREQRFFWRPPRYAFAGFVVLLIVSAVVLGQVGHAPATALAAQFAGNDALLRPQGYREWASVAENVYVDPASYHAYAKTGKFPEGTVIVRERVRPQTSQEADPHGGLAISVKDSNRFEGSWGFFDFSNAAKTQANSDASCRRCHSAGMDIG